MNPNAPLFEPQGTKLSVDAACFVPGTKAVRTRIIPCRFGSSCRDIANCKYWHDSESDNEKEQILSKDDDEKETDRLVHVDDGVKVLFARGMSIKGLMLGTTSASRNYKGKTVDVSGLLFDTTARDVESMFHRFGETYDISMGVAKSGHKKFASATFKTSEAAANAVSALHGTKGSAWVSCSKGGRRNHGTGCVAVVFRKTLSDVKGVSVKVQWYRPTHSAWIHFRTRHQAQNAAQRINGATFNGRKLTASFQKPSFRQTTSFSILVGNLTGEAIANNLVKFIGARAKCAVLSYSIGDLPFRNGPVVVQNLLETYGGPLTSFEMDTRDAHGPKDRALVKFAREADATRACSYFEAHPRTPELGNTSLFLQMIFSFKCVIPATVLGALQPMIDSTFEDEEVRGNARYNIFGNVLKVTAYNKIQIAAAKAKIEKITKGEARRDPKRGLRPYWNRYVCSLGFERDISRLLGDNAGLVWRDTRRRQLLVFGKPETRSSIIKNLRNHFSEMDMRGKHKVKIPAASFTFILQNGSSVVDQIRMASGCLSLSIELADQSLLVEGPTDAVKKVPRCLENVMRGIPLPMTKSRSDEFCPVCFCPPGEDGDKVVVLSCDHTYCSGCFRSWLISGNNCSFPVTCLADGCLQPVLLDQIIKNVDCHDLENLYRLAVDDYICKNIETHKFCIYPTCPGILELTESSKKSVCSTCDAVICLECEAHHEGRSCADYQMASQPPDQIRMKIVNDILTLQCPRCGIAFLDFDGCFAISCSVCPCKFCGWCLKDCGDCGDDAHRHVLGCTSKPPSVSGYFGTEQQFQIAQNSRRVKRLREYLQTLLVEQRDSALDSIAMDLKDLGIPMDSINLDGA